MRSPRAPVTIIPSTRRPHRATSSATASRSRIASAPGLTVSPHSLLRGNVARSTMQTRAPARAATRPAIAPAGPPPTTSTSGAANDEGAVLGAEPEAVAERRRDVGVTPLVRNEIEIAGRVGLVLVDR